MNAGSRARCRWALTLILGLLTLLPVREANAFMILHLQWGVSWLVVCNDGAQLTISGNYSDAYGVGFSYCGEHGGIANITDTDVASAISTINTCDAPSTIVIARQLGGGQYEALTAADIAILLSQSQGQPVELTGYQLTSVNLGGTELHPQPVTNLPTIPISEIYSDQFETGQPVGGRTVPQFCATPMPLAPFTAPLLGLLLIGLGAATLTRRRREVGVA